MLNRCVAKKRRYAEISNEKNQEEIKVYNFKVLLPNGTSVDVRLEQPGDQMHINEFLELVRAEHKRTFKDFDSSKFRRKIFWNSESVYLEDATGCKIRYKILFCQFLPKICHFLILHDGQENMASSYENMWDLTPGTNLLTELPESYTFVTALADLIDNSLQAVWSNNTNERKMISVTVDEARISIFDTGPGMDETEENSIAKWVGSYLPPLAIACYDKYDNHMPFMSIPELDVAINMNGTAILPVEKLKVELLSSNMILQISDILIESGELDKIRPQYEASLGISCSHDKLISLAIPFLVFPGSLQSVKAFIPDLEKQWLPGDVIKEMLLEMYDSYGNHVQQGTEVLLSLDGFCFQDNAGPKRKVDAEGCINLNGILKVIGSFGKTVSFSVEYDGQLLLRNEIQIGERELRILTTLPDNCAAGSLLENIIFEVVDSNGTVDETIHDMRFGQSHMLTITSVSSEENDCVRFMFSHGRCVVPFIIVPREPGIFSFVAAHSCYPELFVVCKVNVMQYPKMKMNLVEHDTVPFQSPGGKMVVFQEEPVSAMWKYNLDDMKKNEDDVKRIGSLIKVLESNLKLLTEEKASTENEISELQDLYRHQTNSHMHDFVTDKEVVIKQIEMNNTAACVWCNIPADIQSQELPDVVGIVALLGSVSTESLSRMLAKYLGEELMLAVVCKSYAAARRLEKYGEGGEVDRSDGLHVVAAQLGRPINCGFLVICLEDLCPFRGKFKSDEDPQKKLSLVDPILPTGEIPSGFLGHAVNMVNIEIQHLHTRTNKGYYLRETLFYLLFGELQVYGTREQMNQARAFVKHGAISLDGGILKSNGILLLGPQREPEVRFPVVAFEAQLQIAPNIKDIAKKIEKNRLELGEISVKCNKVSKEHGKTKKRLGKKMQQLERQYNELGALLKESLLGSNCAADNPIPSGTSVTDNWEEEDST
ncbi:structural maintenance of chromosomes flexible hinge domain-containing protein GMI1-like [Papaver somniferum]|uniref:structural maintenance of chromosomes flexible hinge domain-containing protein GMI1-like n=1 Tax=Papaver somniferum TaxID=3469 RepID=UPI000E7027B3|nr:structural maintenance of chromosomes flexible hinge domain-containing protein GMI1-like [Papaver somniferum]